jgi:hypothetical protein
MYVHTYNHIPSAGVQQYAENPGRVPVSVPISVTPYRANPVLLCPVAGKTPRSSRCPRHEIWTRHYLTAIMTFVLSEHKQNINKQNTIRKPTSRISLQGQVMCDLDSCVCSVWQSLIASPQPHKTVIMCRGVRLVCLPAMSRKRQNGDAISTS